MDLELILDKISSDLYGEDVNDAPRFRPKVNRSPQMPITRRPTTTTTTAPAPAKPVSPGQMTAAPGATTKIQTTPKTAPKKPPRVSIDKTTGRAKIPKAWFDGKGKLRYSKEELNKAVQEARVHHRAAKRLGKARVKQQRAADRMSRNFGRELQFMGQSFNLPVGSALYGFTALGVLGGLHMMLFGMAPTSSDESVQQATNNGVQLVGQVEEPLTSRAINEIQTVAKDITNMYKSGQLSTQARDEVKKLSVLYKLLVSFKPLAINNKADAARFIADADRLALAADNAAEGLNTVMAETISEESKSRMEQLQMTLSEITVAVGNARNQAAGGQS